MTADVAGPRPAAGPDGAELSLLRDMLRRFAADRLRPEFLRWRTEQYPPERILELGELGVLGIRVPAEFGGGGGSFVELGAVNEELGRGDVSVAYFPQLASISAELLKRADVGLQQRWLPPLATGEAVIAYGLTEPSTGSDAAAIKLQLRRDGSDWVLNGEKASITFAGLAAAAVIFGRSGGEGARGVSAVLVPLDAPGVSRQVYGSSSTPLTQRGSLFFDDVRVPADHQIGVEGAGFVSAMQALDFNRALIGLSVMGAAFQSVEETMDYAKQRMTFGQPLAKREAVAFTLAEHLGYLRAARALAYEALAMADAGAPYVAEGAMVKWLGPKLSVDAIHDCIRLHGWMGFSTELPFEARLHDVMSLEVGDGTAEIMKGIIAREAMGREYVAYR
jgi:cyclohexanecarboxyl-CoA dehydrogenase